MAPLAENKPDIIQDGPQQQAQLGPPEKNVAIALNYELPMVDQFLADTRKRYHRAGGVDATLCLTSPHTANLDVSSESARPADQDDTKKQSEHSTETIDHQHQDESSSQPDITTPPPTGKQRRRASTREKPKRTNLARSRVKYDLQLVPRVQRNPSFLDQFDAWWWNSCGVSPSEVFTAKPSSSRRQRVSENHPSPPDRPFLDNRSVVWVPTDRREWEDTVSELFSVCTQAGIQRHTMTPRGNNNTVPFVRPLSQEYIRDRIDIDDPLTGFQLRHREGGWLQGFVMYTNFTTWNHGFRWDSLHPASGVESTESLYKDIDGSIAAELENEPRSGDLSAGGIVCPSIAEIALLGGLGCGEYLLRMALDSIREANKHRFVVLQATDQSKAFYERFGFIRVGAVCQYGKGAVLLDLAGYRHWTHANESEISLEKHGGPSYMMCLKLPPPLSPTDPLQEQTEPTLERKPSYLERMMALRVVQKPVILALGTAGTPAPKVFKRIGAIENAATTANTATIRATPNTSTAPARPLPKKPVSSKTGRKRGRPPKHRPPDEAVVKPKSASTTPKRTPAPRKPTTSKRRAESTTPAKRKRPKNSHVMSSAYVEKQYNDIWLAVPAVKPPGVLGSQPPKRKRGRPRKHPRPAPASTKRSATPKASTSTSKTGHVFHAVRGPDGKFIRVGGSSKSRQRDKPAAAPPKRDFSRARVQPKRVSGSNRTDLSKKAASNSTATSSPKNGTNAPIFFLTSVEAGKPKPIERLVIRKQKVKSHPRDRVHFFNRVVRFKTGNKGKYFFVLEFDEETDRLCLVPMHAEGMLTGKREGRPRYQCVLGETDENFLIVGIDDCEIVKSAMVMKTPMVAIEAWDIDTDNAMDFETR